MKRSKSKPNKKRTGGPSQLGAEKASALGRKKAGNLIRNLLIFGVAALTLAALAVWGYRITNADRNLALIGNGKPAVVQIHDVTCVACEVLQANALRALGAFDKNDYEYVIADVRRSDGLRYANSLGLSITTLVLTDPDGRPTGALQGERSTSELQEQFTDHFAAFGVEPK